MAAVTHLDTHVVVWLRAGVVRKLSRQAKKRIERTALAISPVVALELQMLYEIGRIREPADTILAALQENPGLTFCPHHFTAVAQAATAFAWTRDPFDRLIVAQATAAGAALLTKDSTILDNCPTAVW